MSIETGSVIDQTHISATRILEDRVQQLQEQKSNVRFLLVKLG
jgi:hypothetical protein